MYRAVPSPFLKHLRPLFALAAFSNTPARLSPSTRIPATVVSFATRAYFLLATIMATRRRSRARVASASSQSLGNGLAPATSTRVKAPVKLCTNPDCKDGRKQAHARCIYDRSKNCCLEDAGTAFDEGRDRPPCPAPGHLFTSPPSPSSPPPATPTPPRTSTASPAPAEEIANASGAAPVGRKLADPLHKDWYRVDKPTWLAAHKARNTKREEEAQRQDVLEQCKRDERSSARVILWLEVRHIRFALH